MDFEQRRDRAFKPREAEQARQVTGQILQAAIAAEHVTGTPEWDRLLTIIQAHIETAKQEKKALESAIMARGLVDPNAIMQVKIDALIVSERINVLEAVVALPSDIMKNAESAKLNLRGKSE